MILLLCAVLICVPFVRASPPGLNDTCILTLDANGSNSPSCNTRTLWDILSSCGLTLFACTWTAILPNIPHTHATRFSINLHRLLLMVVALIAPEVILAWAAWQFLCARRVCQDSHPKWTLTHGFFTWMGGFMLYIDGFPRATLAPDELISFIREGAVDIPDITEADIMDQSKGDVATLQLVWFTIQLFARYIQKLPVTLLEIDTLAVVALTFATHCCWWNKPQNIGRPYIVHWKNSTAPPLHDTFAVEYVIATNIQNLF
ncbi:hypothetical protein DFJ58DRAFT_662667 [Suillus subalutaceus]|uniref:uncharacterized protein n=1 Tax=Suillus subalutaceus TaxID=48586 RepID=UPI001B86B962|nr:uncharacterized protein DFJ58DRAFT_662667 [Suillus subalutaceus]KAG1848978.1 hypothetical protein DFJ58DRAFT_662667 [Suillus subalutaceus]